MSFGRYHYPQRRRISGRLSTARKLILVGDLLSILLIFLIFMLLFSPPFHTEKFFSAGNSLLIFSEGLRPDYLSLLYQLLPGMRLEQEEAVFPGGNSPDLRGGHFQNYPQMVLTNEIAGFWAANTRGGLTTGSESRSDNDNDNNYNDNDNQQNFSSGSSPDPSSGSSPDPSSGPSPEGEEEIGFLVDRNPAAPKERPLVSNNNNPLVLIYHTHASESFVPVSGKAYSDNPNETVVYLGDYLARILQNSYGIPVLHHREVFDGVRDGSYERARPVIEKILRQNPQIEVVVDLHRDGVPRRVTTGNVRGVDTGRLLFVVGTRHRGWTDNLRFTLFVQNILEEKYPGLSRGIRQYAYVYNQNLHPRSLLIEIGGHENTAEEVKRTIPCLADALASVFE